MELDRAGNHPSALSRDLPLGPVNGASILTRYDPMRLPDVHRGPAEAKMEDRPRAIRAEHGNTTKSERAGQRGLIRQTTRDSTRRERDYRNAGYHEPRAQYQMTQQQQQYLLRSQQMQQMQQMQEMQQMRQKQMRQNDAAVAQRSMRGPPAQLNSMHKLAGVQQQQQPQGGPMPKGGMPYGGMSNGAASPTSVFTSILDPPRFSRKQEAVLRRERDADHDRRQVASAFHVEEDRRHKAQTKASFDFAGGFFVPGEVQRSNYVKRDQDNSDYMYDPNLQVQGDRLGGDLAEELADLRLERRMRSRRHTLRYLKPEELVREAEREAERESREWREVEHREYLERETEQHKDWKREEARTNAPTEIIPPKDVPIFPSLLEPIGSGKLKTTSHTPPAESAITSPFHSEYQGRQTTSSTALSHRQRLGLVCQTVSRDDTSSEDAKISFFVKMAMEPHIRKAQPSESFRANTPTFMPPSMASSTRTNESKRTKYTPPNEGSRFHVM